MGGVLGGKAAVEGREGRRVASAMGGVGIVSRAEVAGLLVVVGLLVVEVVGLPVAGAASHGPARQQGNII